MAINMEIVCVGNELLIGKVVNTNATWIGKRSTSMGITVKRITTVADDIKEMSIAFQEILSRKPNFIISSGGLGPTFDDKTLEGIAKAIDRRLFVNIEALEMVKAKYLEYTKTRNTPESEMTPPRVKMATIPEDSKPLVNPEGTAPAVLINIHDTVLIALPGVPREMEAIFEESVAPLLKKAAGDLGFYELSIYANNIMESVLAPLIDKVMHDNPQVYIKSHPKGREIKPHMELHLSTSGNPTQNPQDHLNNAAKQLSELIKQRGGEIQKTVS